MERDGVIDRYAIGGAVAAALYLEPVATLDIDIFVSFRTQPGQLLITPQPLYDYLIPRGASVEGEYLIIAGWPVQFLPPTGPLAEEALKEAAETVVAGISTRIFSPDHLAALALETGRPKDMARVVLFVESGVLDADKFSGILSRYGLTEKWRTFEQRFLP
jgi:hypothetical protein